MFRVVVYCLKVTQCPTTSICTSAPRTATTTKAKIYRNLINSATVPKTRRAVGGTTTVARPTWTVYTYTVEIHPTFPAKKSTRVWLGKTGEAPRTLWLLQEWWLDHTVLKCDHGKKGLWNERNSPMLIGTKHAVLGICDYELCGGWVWTETSMLCQDVHESLLLFPFPAIHMKSFPCPFPFSAICCHFIFFRYY